MGIFLWTFVAFILGVCSVKFGIIEICCMHCKAHAQAMLNAQKSLMELRAKVLFKGEDKNRGRE